MKRNLIITVLCLFMILPLFAEVETTTKVGADAAYYPDQHAGYGAGSFVPFDYTPVDPPDGFPLAAGDGGRTLGSGWGGVEATSWFSHSIKMPFMVMDGPLTSGNNLNFKFKANLSPVTGDLGASVVLTPVAVLQLEAGGMIGTGWAALGFNGMGLMNSDGIADEDSFAGIVTKAWCAGTFQFDLAAVMPGEWNHVVMIANAKLEYQNYSAASDTQSWVWQSDAGENYNGMTFAGTYLLGYQMPLRLNTVGILVDTKENLGDVRELSTMAADGWGSDFRTVKIAPLFVVDLTDNSSLTILLQFSNLRVYTDDTIFNNYFQNREYEDTAWKFHRIAFSYGIEL
ncbi:MAG: hypothetical protein JEY99_12945 [Spirochaetales bacterium]|nr:hypothetical protein [Spirochaetales bacterium]